METSISNRDFELDSLSLKADAAHVPCLPINLGYSGLTNAIIEDLPSEAAELLQSVALLWMVERAP